MRWVTPVVAALIACVLSARGAAAFVTFEAGQVRPLAFTPNGQTLLALDTPDARLEIFRVDGGDVIHVGAVQVGLEPVAVAARSDREAWVVNHLSDSISIVDIAATPPRVVRTLLVGDEPRDIVFAGPRDRAGNFRRAFVTTARLGQNLPESVPMELTTPGTPRALVFVFDATHLGSSLGGTPEAVVALFGDTPRALAATPDGRSVYAAVFQSGNETTTVTEGAVCDGGALASSCPVDGVQVAGGLPGALSPGGLPLPNQNVEGMRGPEVGLIVKHNRSSGLWEDELGRNWTNAVRFDLPDLDVFRIDALADPPREAAAYAHVGTILFNMLVNPADGKLYVTNTEARNEVRFEGSGALGTSLRGHLHEARITVIDGHSVLPRHLNKHITALPQGYLTMPMPAGVKEASLSTPVDMALASDGTLYVAAFGSSKVGVFDAGQIEDDSFVPDAAHHIEVSGGGPSGLALDEAHQRLYVLTRFDDALKVIDTASRQEISQHPLHDPEPASVVEGRPFLYDARFTSSNGEASCATCHVFGDFDSLAWDLGNPDDVVKPNPNPLGPTGANTPFHPMKGPMTTQTLRGMVNQGPMHWRGDRTGGKFFGDEIHSLDSTLAFEQFNVAFESLLGRDEGEISDEDMEAFTEFALQIEPPPNPVRSLDNQLTDTQEAGRVLFRDRAQRTDPAASCRGCHTLTAADGHFGTLGQTTFDTETQEFKVPQLKNAYQKVGMFGTPNTTLADILPDDARHQGEQIRGFGFLHDGSTATVFDFLRLRVFTLDDVQRHNLEDFVLAFETTFAPIVGQQITLTSINRTAVDPRIDLMIARAETDFALVNAAGAKECELVVKAVVQGEPRGYLFDAATGRFRTDRADEPEVSDADLRGFAEMSRQEVTYTCAPPGEGVRLGLDRDVDGVFDRDEVDNGTDPTDPGDPVETPTPRPTRTATPTATATPTQRVTSPGDADCDEIVDAADTSATCSAAFDPSARARCDADCNGDGRVSAADVTCVAEIVARVAR